MSLIRYLLIGILLLSSFCIAVDVPITTYYGSTNELNLSFGANNNQTYFLPINRYSYLSNYSLNLSLDIADGVTYSEKCRQNNIDTNTTCGSRYSDIPINFSGAFGYAAQMFDDDPATCVAHSFNSFIMTLVYRIPQDSNQPIKWNVTNGDGNFEILIPNNCSYNHNNLTLKVESSDTPSVFDAYCYTNLSVWQHILNQSSTYFCEEGMTWNISYLMDVNSKIVEVKNNTPTPFQFNNTPVNTILSASCACTNCSLLGNNCNYPVSFSPRLNSITNLITTPSGYSTYDFNACTGSSIPSNASMLNYTGKYETNQSLVNIDVTTGSYLTWNLHGETTTSTIYPSISNQTSFGYCGYPNWANFDLDYSVNYNPTSSPLNVRQRSASDLLLNNVISTIPLYVSTSDSTGTIRVKIIDGFQNPIQDANVIAQRTISGTTYTVQTAVSDSVGMTYLSLDTLQQYTITASKTGYSATSVTIIPTTTDIYSLTLGGQSSQNASCLSGVGYSFLPASYELMNLTDYTFMFNMTSSQCDVTACSMSIYTGPDLMDSLAGVYNASTCGAYAVFNTGNYTNITVIGTYTLESVSYSNQKVYYPTDWNPGEYSMLTVFNDIKNFSGSGFDWRSKMLITFIIIFMITGIASWKFNSLINPEAAILLQFGLVLLFSVAGWMEIPSYVISFPQIGDTNLGKYAIMFLDLLVSGAFIVWRLR